MTLNILQEKDDFLWNKADKGLVGSIILNKNNQGFGGKLRFTQDNLHAENFGATSEECAVYLAKEIPSHYNKPILMRRAFRQYEDDKTIPLSDFLAIADLLTRNRTDVELYLYNELI